MFILYTDVLPMLKHSALKKSTTSIMQLKLTVKLVGSFVFKLNSSAYEPAALLIVLFIV